MRFTRIVALFLTLALPCAAYAQKSKNPKPRSRTTASAPSFPESMLYRDVRPKLMKMGWRPIKLPSAEGCSWENCKDFPETLACYGVGRAPCQYTWERDSSQMIVTAVGEGSQYFAGAKICKTIVKVPLPVGGWDCTISRAREGVQTMTLATEHGGIVVVNDFIHNGITRPDKANPGEYLLAGTFGYCSSDPQCHAAPATNFIVGYSSAQQAFHISLTERPIRKARLDMEKFMLHTLGLTEKQLCRLTYFVMTTSYVSPQFGGDDLRFSFCPGATKLP